MDHSEVGCFDPETIALLRAALDEAWDALPATRKETVAKSERAQRILAAASQGERDPARLRAIALMRPMNTSAEARAASILQIALSRNA
jgi:hypothetical protein